MSTLNQGDLISIPARPNWYFRLPCLLRRWLAPYVKERPRTFVINGNHYALTDDFPSK